VPLPSVLPKQLAVACPLSLEGIARLTEPLEHGLFGPTECRQHLYHYSIQPRDSGLGGPEHARHELQLRPVLAPHFVPLLLKRLHLSLQVLNFSLARSLLLLVGP